MASGRSPRGNIYCGLSEAEEADMRDRRWSRLPAVPLSEDTRRALDRAMPGTQSNLQRHQWMKHGTCYAAEPETYFRHALMLLGELNGSAVRDFFVESIGARITADEVRRRFDAAFGSAAGDRVVLRCRDDGGRRLITELQIHLRGPLDDESRLGERMASAGTRGAAAAAAASSTRSAFNEHESAINLPQARAEKEAGLKKKRAVASDGPSCLEVGDAVRRDAD